MRLLRLRQVDIVEGAEFSPSYVSAIIRGRRRPTERFLDVIEEKFGIRRAWVLEGVHPMADADPWRAASAGLTETPEENRSQSADVAEKASSALRLLIEAAAMADPSSTDARIMLLAHDVTAKCTEAEKLRLAGFLEGLLAASR